MTKIGDIESFDYSLLATEATLNQVSGTVDEIDIVLGEKLDLVVVPYTEGLSSALAFLHTGYYHVHGASFIYPDKANPVQLTSSASAWSQTGNIIEVIPANAVAKDFDLHWASIAAISANLYGIVDIFAGGVGAEVKIGSVEITRTDNFSQEGNKPIQIPQQPANTRISCRFSDSTSSAQTCVIKFYGHVYSAEE
jgi:hypothetical protein